MTEVRAETETRSSDYPPQKEYDKIYKHLLCNEDDWSELRSYVRYLANYCTRVGIEDKPEQDAYILQLKSFFGTYRFASGRHLKINLDAKKISDEEKKYMLKQIIEWLGIVGPNLRVSLEMLDPCGMREFELSFSMLLNEVTSNLMKEYLPLALEVRKYISANIVGTLEIARTIRNFTRGEFLFTSERTRANLESLPVLFLIRMHYEMLSALDKLKSRIERLARSKDQEKENHRRLNFALLREVRKNKACHVDLLCNPIYSNMLEKSLETDFEDQSILEKVRKEASAGKSLNDLLYLWDSFRGKKAPKPQINDLLGGGYAFKPASKLYELWTLREMLNAISNAQSQDWSAKFELGKAIFYLRNGHLKWTLTYNFARRTLQRFRPGFSLRPDFVLASRSIEDESETERVVLIADAKYKSRPDPEDFERMLAYLMSYSWSRSQETANGLLLFIGTNAIANGTIQSARERKNPDARIYSVCLRPDPKSNDVAEKSLRGLLDTFYHQQCELEPPKNA
jgi:hypothetical protein